MNIIVQKRDEDRLLAVCDGTCINDKNCACVVDLKIPQSGQSMHYYGLEKCVLCYRKEFLDKRPYTVLVNGYPTEWIIDGGKFIRWSVNDYEVLSSRSLKHKIDPQLALHPDDWISKLFYCQQTKVLITTWKMFVCTSQKCTKSPVRSFVDVSRAIGMTDAYKDLSTDELCCLKCHNALKSINSDHQSGLVTFAGIKYSRCRFCNTIVTYVHSRAVQYCSGCKAQHMKSLLVMQSTCYYCKCSVSVNKRGGTQLIKTEDDVLYFCKAHRIRGLDCNVQHTREMIDSYLNFMHHGSSIQSLTPDHNSLVHSLSSFES